MKMKKQILASVIALNLVACSSSHVEQADVNPLPHDTYKGEGLFSGKTGNLLESLQGNGASLSQGTVAAIPVNVYLWQASLDAISFMPLASASSTDGIIITDWYTNPNKMGERLKVNIYVLGKSFNARNLKVSVFKQIKKSGDWVDVPTSADTSAQLEDTILTNARALKIKAHALSS